MMNAESTHAAAALTPRAQAAGPEGALGSVPPQPKSVRDTGLEQQFIAALIAKSIYVAGKIRLPVLTGKLRLSINVLREVLDFMLAEQLVEVAWRGESDLDVQYQLTPNGKLRAADYMAACRYVGPAPVTLAAYCEIALRQSGRQAGAARVSAPDMTAAFGDDTLEPAVRELIGAAMHSSRSLLLYGPSGSGKTTLARKLGRLQPGLVAVPYAILIDQDIVQFYDPLVHPAPTPLQARQSEDRRSVDTRWVLCQRPLVQVGSELSDDMLDLREHEAGGLYHAPPHFLANNGILIVDDLGRQRVPTGDLLNRWSGPLDAGVDQLTLHGGHKVNVPFDVTMVFATNLAPQVLLDDSFMRRIGYKVHIGPISEANYRKLFRHQCLVSRVVYDEAVIEHLLQRLHAGAKRPLLASYPRELLGRIADFAGFAGVAPRLTVPALELAWQSMFAGCAHGTAAPALPPASFNAASGDSLFERI